MLRSTLTTIFADLPLPNALNFEPISFFETTRWGHFRLTARNFAALLRRVFARVVSLRLVGPCAGNVLFCSPLLDMHIIDTSRAQDGTRNIAVLAADPFPGIRQHRQSVHTRFWYH